MNLTPPPKRDAEDYVPLPEDMHEVYIKDFSEGLKRQDFWKDPEVPEHQIEWTFVVRDKEGDEEQFNGRELKYWTGNGIGRHPKNKFTNLVKLVVKDFNLDDESTYFKDESDFRKRVQYQPLRAVTTNSEKEVKQDDGTTRTFINAKVTALLKSTKKPLSKDDMADAVAQSIGGKVVTSDGDEAP